MDVGFHKENMKFFNHFGIAEESGIPTKRIALVLQEKCKENPNVQQTYILSANLLARLFLNIDFVIPNGTCLSKLVNDNGSLLSEYILLETGLIFAQGNFKTIHNIPDPSDYNGILVVGCSAGPSDGNLVSVVSDGWNIYFNESEFTPSNYNPIGACAAACMGVAELFKIVTEPLGSKSCGHLTFSLLNYDTDSPDSNPELPSIINIGQVTLVGVGAIGSGVIYTLKTLANVIGQLDLVDRDRYSDSNLNRYVIANDSNKGMYKVDIAKKILIKHPDLIVNKHKELYQDYNKKHASKEILITAVDKRVTRFIIQSDIPKLIIDAATTDSLIDLARVDFGQGGACLGCLYMPEPRDVQVYNDIMNFTGLPLKRVKYLYDSSAGLDNNDIQIVSTNLGKNLDYYMGSPIDTLYAHEFCGSGKIKGDSQEIIAPVSFISAFAGVLVVCELVKNMYFQQYKVNNHLLFDTLKVPNPRLHNFKKYNPNCPYCNDDVFLDTYNKKWGHKLANG